MPMKPHEPGTYAADPHMVILVSGYWAKLPHYVLEHVWREESDHQHYCAVGYANRNGMDPNDTRVFHVMQIPTGELRYTEVEFIDATKKYEAKPDAATKKRHLQIVREREADNQRVLDEHEATMGELVIRNVNAKRGA